MSPTREELLARLTLGEPDRGPVRSVAAAARRMTGRADWALATSRSGSGKARRFPLMSGRELVDGLRRRDVAFVFPALAPGVPEPFHALQPRPARLLELVEVTTTGASVVSLVSEQARVGAAGSVAEGATFPTYQPAVEGGVLPTNFTPMANYATAVVGVDGRALEDSDQAAAIFERITTGNWQMGLEADLVSGGGAVDADGTTHPLGVLTALANAGVAPVAYAAGTARAAQIATVLGGLGDSGFGVETAPIIAARPSVLARIVGDTSDLGAPAMSVLPAGTTLVPSLGVPDGSAVVGDPSYIRVFLGEQIEVETTTGYQDFLLRGLVAIRVVARCFGWVSQVGAWQQVTGL